MRKRIFMVMAVLVLAFAPLAAPTAYAADIVSAGATKADVETEDVAVSTDSDNLAAAIDGCAFAVGDFERASKGSNREIADEYHGYSYYVGSKSSTLMYFVTEAMVLVYVDPDAAGEVLERVERAYLKAFPSLEGKYLGCVCDSADGVDLRGGLIR